MHRNPKLDAQIAEEAGLMAQPEGVPSVAKPDLSGEQGLELAQEQAQQGSAEPSPKPSPAPKFEQEHLDKERAASEGMTAPASQP